MTVQTAKPLQGNVDLFEASLRSPEPLWELHGALRGLLARGADREALIQELARFKDDLASAGRDEDWEIIYEVLTFFEGWCLPHLKL